MPESPGQPAPFEQTPEDLLDAGLDVLPGQTVRGIVLGDDARRRELAPVDHHRVVVGAPHPGLDRRLHVGRVGAPRSALVGYLVPLVAVILGIVVRDESVGAVELAGTGLILLGATLISRAR